MYLDIYEAIERRRLLQVRYGGYYRVVEPRIYGNNLDGHDLLKVFQIAGTDEMCRHIGWKWFTVSQMDSVLVLSTAFSASRPPDGGRDRPLQHVYCEVNPRPGEGYSLAPDHIRRR